MPLKNWKFESFHLNGNQVSFLNTISNLFISTKVTKEMKIGNLSPKWRLSVFSKYSPKFICFHKVHKRTENWKAFTWMATKCLFKFICFHKGHKTIKNWMAWTWMATKCIFNILNQIYLFPHRSQKNWKLESFHLNGDI